MSAAGSPTTGNPTSGGPTSGGPAAGRCATSTRVTVVIVSYRSAALTIDCLRSLAGERHDPGLELTAVVIDNASGDFAPIAAAIKADGWGDWAVVVAAPKNGGFAYGNNQGIAEAFRRWDPDYIHLLNPDTWVKPGAVRALVDFMKRTPGAGIAGSSFANGDGSDWPIAFRFGSEWSELEKGLELGLATRLLRRFVVARVMAPREQPVDWCAGASMLLSRALLAAIGGMDERFFLYFEESEFCWRARQAGFATWYVPGSRVVHIAGQSTGVTERDAALKPLPAYWFESRRRYFQLTLGLGRAMLADVLALVGGALGEARLKLQGQRHRIVPGYLAGIWQHSVLHRRNRVLAPALTPRFPQT